MLQHVATCMETQIQHKIVGIPGSDTFSMSCCVHLIYCSISHFIILHTHNLETLIPCGLLLLNSNTTNLVQEEIFLFGEYQLLSLFSFAWLLYYISLPFLELQVLLAPFYNQALVFNSHQTCNFLPFFLHIICVIWSSCSTVFKSQECSFSSFGSLYDYPSFVWI